MNPSTASSPARQAVPPSIQPLPGDYDARQSQATPAASEHNPAHTDDSPHAILGYN